MRMTSRRSVPGRWGRAISAAVLAAALATAGVACSGGDDKKAGTTENKTGTDTGAGAGSGDGGTAGGGGTPSDSGGSPSPTSP